MFKEKSFEYNEIPKISEDFILFGYYQSDKYFNNNFNKIYDLLNIRESRDKVKENTNIYLMIMIQLVCILD